MSDPSRNRIPRPSPRPGWSLRMAWRDSRGHRRVLVLSALCILFGIAALVAIGSLRDNLGRIMEEQTRALLGADLVLEARRPFDSSLEAFFRRMGGEQAAEVRFQSMAAFPGREASRFVQVRAVRGGFPFYGAFDTEPVGLREPASGEVVVEDSLLVQMGLGPGDTVRLGEAEFTVAGSLRRVAGESEITGAFAPRIYIAWDEVERTGLVQAGSMVRHRQYFAFAEGLDERRGELLREARESIFMEGSVRAETVESRRRNLERLLGNLFDFLNLVGFVALLLGGLGVGGAVQVHVRGKLVTVALLRCLGGSVWSGFRIFLIQVAGTAVVGAVAGAALGIGVQFLLPVFLRGFLPFELHVAVSWGAVAGGLVFGWLVALAFALIPLLGVRHISPLATIRADFDGTIPRPWKDPLILLVYAGLAGLLVTFALMQTNQFGHGLAFSLGFGATLAALALFAGGLRRLLRAVTPREGPFAWRLALGNLHRPQNRTIYLVVTLGAGAFLINTLFLARANLLEQVGLTDTGDAANVVLLDVQPDQVDEVEEFLADRGHVLQDRLPIITMRLSAVNGRSMAELRRDPDVRVREWVTRWEFRTTYRGQLLDNETVAEGGWVSRHTGGEPYSVSIAENMLADMGARVGDRLLWDVQGVPVESIVTSSRTVNWQAGRQNFGVVFAPGTIEAAPTIFAVTTRVRDRAQTAELQQGIVAAFPNLSVIDLTLIFETIDDLLGRAGFVVQFMAAFTILTGLLVLAAAIVTSRYQRIRESALLRTLGARAGLIRSVMAVEYALVGACAGLVGGILALAAGWGLSRFVFESEFVANPAIIALSVLVMALLTLATGLLNSRRIATHSPLLLLREEG
ncbi:MAG: ABC transporter permease [Opitutales bacterium]|nr:ABC transporter permease [Opitutales bacterium]